MMFIIRKSALAVVIAVSAAAMLGCSSSDDGKSAELQKQLDMANADLMTAEQERDTARQAQTDAETAKMTAEQERDAARQAQTDAETAKMTAEQERDAARQAQTDAETAKMTAEQTLADAQFNTAVANAVEKVTAWGLRQEFDAEDGRLHGTTARHSHRQAYPDSGSEFAVLSQTYENGDEIVFAMPWHDENGELQFLLDSTPRQGSLHD